MNINGALTQITSNKSVLIDGCESIIDFSDEKVDVRSGRLKISINGKGLRIKIFTENTAVIEGLVLGVNFSYL